MGYPGYLADNAHRMRLVIDQADSVIDAIKRQELLLGAAVIGCNTLREVSKDPFLREDIELVLGLKEKEGAEVNRILSSLDAFEEFLAKEERILVEGGFNPFLAKQVTDYCRDLREKVLREDTTVSQVMEAFAALEGQACRLSSELRTRAENEAAYRKDASRLKRIGVGMVGVGLAGVNVGLGITTAGFGLGAAAVSGILGAKMIEKAAFPDK